MMEKKIEGIDNLEGLILDPPVKCPFLGRTTRTPAGPPVPPPAPYVWVDRAPYQWPQFKYPNEIPLVTVKNALMIKWSFGSWVTHDQGSLGYCWDAEILLDGVKIGTRSNEELRGGYGWDNGSNYYAISKNEIPSDSELNNHLGPGMSGVISCYPGHIGGSADYATARISLSVLYERAEAETQKLI